ncbi:MAG: hypothetical protein LBQ66_11765 [Planctomycetaceae bacterium]|nr:hypothetical protein [Planctomycetaceae bacterium]
MRLLLIFFEVTILFFVFCVFGGSPIPDINEPYYIGKAIHFWNYDWVVGDTFLDSEDSHLTFYFLFGWLSFFLSPYWMAVFGRVLTWYLLAFGWVRLCYVLFRVRWCSIPTGLALAYYVSSFNMAGEWILGGVEGKSFAFPFVMIGMAELVRGRFNRVWIFFGIASAFHVIVGGWSVAAAIIVHVFCRRKPDYFFMLLGGVIALPGVIPGLLLDYGTVGDVVQKAHKIYVFDRLNHHLVPYMFTWTRILRFVLLTLLWIFCCRFTSGNSSQKRFDFFVSGTIIISLVGFLLAYIFKNNENLSATLLRFYWFRMSDVAVPMGVAIGSMHRLLRMIESLIARMRGDGKEPIKLPTLFETIIVIVVPIVIFMAADYCLFGGFMFSWQTMPDAAVAWGVSILVCRAILFSVTRWDFSVSRSFGERDKLAVWSILFYGVILIYAPISTFMGLADERTRFAFPKSESKRPAQAYQWRDVCNWIADTKNVPKSAKFYVPLDSVTFKWYANRSNLPVWKEVPQDAKLLVKWAESMEELFSESEQENSTPEQQNRLADRLSKKSFAQMLSKKSNAELLFLKNKYKFDYILAQRNPDISKKFNLKIIYQNKEYRVYKIE